MTGLSLRAAAPPPPAEGVRRHKTLASGSAHLRTPRVPPLRFPKAPGVRESSPPRLLAPSSSQWDTGRDRLQKGPLSPPKDVSLPLGRPRHGEHHSTPAKVIPASSYRATKPQSSPGARIPKLLLSSGRNEGLSVLVIPFFKPSRTLIQAAANWARATRALPRCSGPRREARGRRQKAGGGGGSGRGRGVPRAGPLAPIRGPRTASVYLAGGVHSEFLQFLGPRSGA